MHSNMFPFFLGEPPLRPEERRQGTQPAGADGRLAELRQLDGYVIRDGDPDVRGWEVRTSASFGDRAAGHVEDLIVDLDTLRARYMLVCLDKDAVATTRDRRILVPVGTARVSEYDEQVRLDGYTIGHLVGVPEFRPGKLTRHYERVVRRRFEPPGPKAGPRSRRATDFYDQVEFDDRSFWGARRRGREHLTYLVRHD